MDEDTANFLRILERQNVAIAAAEAKKEALKEDRTDHVRLQREKERREKWGTLRAREQPGKRPYRARRLFGYIDLS